MYVCAAALSKTVVIVNIAGGNFPRSLNGLKQKDLLAEDFFPEFHLVAHKHYSIFTTVFLCINHPSS